MVDSTKVKVAKVVGIILMAFLFVLGFAAMFLVVLTTLPID